MGKFIDLRCDFGFKYCMSDPIIMKSFLNAILDGDEDKITKVRFQNVEMPATLKERRGVTFDLYCTTNKGDSILIEMQNSCQKFFKTRANFYVYKLMDSKIKRGLSWRKMKKDIPKIIGIFIMGKTTAGIDKVVTRTAECDLDTGALFWDRHRKYFINLQKFKFDGGNFTLKDIWLYSFKNLGSMENIDSSVYERADKGLLRLIEKARVGALSIKDQMLYEASMKMLEDEEPTYEEGLKEGRKEGREEGMKEGREEGMKEGREEGANDKAIQIATDMKRKGLDAALIHELTHLTLEDIEKL